MNGPFYLAGAIVLGAGFLYTSIRFANNRSTLLARQLFFASIIYLPLLLVLLVADKRNPTAADSSLSSLSQPVSSASQ